MKITPFRIKWILNLYPPLLFNRIFIKSVSKDFTKVEVKTFKSLLNRNFEGSIFGGTIFSSIDPIFPVMYWLALKEKGLVTEAWLKKAEIRYKKPAYSSLKAVFRINENDLIEAQEGLKANQKFERNHTIELKDESGEVCAICTVLVHLRIRENAKPAAF